MFDTWMADLISNKQIQEVETDKDNEQDDEVHIVDTSAPVLREKESGINQSVPDVETEARDVDMTEEQSEVTVRLSVHDEDSENPRVRIDLETPQGDFALASLIASYSENMEQVNDKSEVDDLQQ